jgi:iron complex transport system ATP-binding protein
MTQPRTVIDIHGLCFRFETNKVLQNISMKINPASINAILGQNGSGKTTLLRLILGLLQPTAGDISICGLATHPGAPAALKRLVSVVPQTEPISFDLNVQEYVLLGRAPHLPLFRMPNHHDRAVALQSIRTVGIEHLVFRPVLSLSGGENQLARIARALTQETDIILLDEPTAHLDLSNIKIVTDIMRQLAINGKTIIYTTNDPNIVSIAADRVFMLKDQCLTASGPPSDVFTEENLSRVYGVDVEVFVKNGRSFVLIGNR